MSYLWDVFVELPSSPYACHGGVFSKRYGPLGLADLTSGEFDDAQLILTKVGKHILNLASSNTRAVLQFGAIRDVRLIGKHFVVVQFQHGFLTCKDNRNPERIAVGIPRGEYTTREAARGSETVVLLTPNAALAWKKGAPLEPKLETCPIMNNALDKTEAHVLAELQEQLGVKPKDELLGEFVDRVHMLSMIKRYGHNGLSSGGRLRARRSPCRLRATPASQLSSR